MLHIRISSTMGIRIFPKWRRPSVSKGLLAGAIGGLAGALTKAAAEAIYPPRVQGQPSPPVVLAERVAGHRLKKKQQQVAETAIHYLFSALTGALYGAVAEWIPAVTTGSGAAFALALLAGTHESALPALDLVEPPPQQPAREHLSEALTHVIYGVTTEQVRRSVRAAL